MNLLDLENEKIKEVTIQGHNFKIRYMTPLDRVKITQRRMRLQDGNPVTSLTDGDYIFFENIAIVDVCVEEYPKNIKAHETCANWENVDLINELAHEIRTHTTDLEAKLKKINLLSEATKPEYFVDGFLMKYFGIWPNGIDKNNLFDEQKVFLVYLMGAIPSQDDWGIQVDYKIRLQEIRDLKDVDISPEDMDLARLQGKNIKELKRERLEQEKIKLTSELNKSFGIKEKTEMPERPKGLPKNRTVDEKVQQEELWSLLQGKGLVKGNGL